MNQCTHEICAEYWEGIVKACGQLPPGQSAKSQMDENGIYEQSYYHWQHKFRKPVYGLIKGSVVVSEVPEKAYIRFVEVPYIQPVRYGGETILDVAVIQTSSVRLEITNDISYAVLTRISKEVIHA